MYTPHTPHSKVFFFGGGEKCGEKAYQWQGGVARVWGW